MATKLEITCNDLNASSNTKYNISEMHSTSQYVSAHLFHSILFIIGLSIGLACSICLRQSFSSPYITFPSFSTQKSILVPSVRLLSPQPQDRVAPQSSEPVVQTVTTASNERSVYTKNKTFSLWHNMSDEELFMKVLTYIDNVSENVIPKVAFMFLTPGPLPLAPLWNKFFKGYGDLYTIYIHSHPSYNKSMPTDSPFHGRSIPSQPVHWGTISMIDAERRLLANALMDSSNQRFVLLSDSCIPVFNFTTIYNYLMGTNYSFLGSFDDPRIMGRGRYNRKMWPMITIDQWRKGSQWFEIHRDLAIAIVSDHKYYWLFQNFCHKPCYSDEHYLPTLVNILFPEMNSNRSVTWVHWPKDGPHPSKFGRADVRVELVNQIRYGSNCTYNGDVTNVCHLFGRKFLPSSLKLLLELASSVFGYD